MGGLVAGEVQNTQLFKKHTQSFKGREQEGSLSQGSRQKLYNIGAYLKEKNSVRKKGTFSCLLLITPDGRVCARPCAQGGLEVPRGPGLTVRAPPWSSSENAKHPYQALLWAAWEVLATSAQSFGVPS